MSNDLKLEVRLGLIDKVLAPLKRIQGGSAGASKAIKETRDRLKELNATQRAVGEFRELRTGLRGTEAALEGAQAKVKALAQKLYANGPPTKAMVRDFDAAKRSAAALGEQHTKQGQQVQLLRDRLSAASVSTAALALKSRTMREEQERLNATLKIQQDRLRTLGEQQRKHAALQEAHQKRMSRNAAMAGAGGAGLATGYVLSRPLSASVGAFADQETAASQLSASMMVADGSVPAEYEQISRLAQRLGDRLPGTTADFYKMMTVLRKEGMTSKAILGGVGEAAAYLGVQLQLPIDTAAKFAAQMQDATRATEDQMMDLMDVIQRTFYLGMDDTQMLAGFSKMSGVMNTLRMSGVQAARALSPLLVMMNQSGMNDGGSAGNAIRKVVDAGLNAKKLGKTNALLADQHAGFKLSFVDKKGKYAGLENLFAQLDKIKSIKSDVGRMSVLTQLFGDDAETLQVLQTMMDKGITGYREVVDKMQSQADLRKRVEAALGTLANVAEAAQGVGTNVLASATETVAPELKQLVGWLGRVGESVGEWIKKNPALTAAIMKVAAVIVGLYLILGGLLIAVAGFLGPLAIMSMIFARLGLSLNPLSAMLRGLSAGFGLVLRAVLLLGRALLMNPIGLTVTGIAVAALLLYKYWGPVSEFFAAMWEKIKSTFLATLLWFGQLPLTFYNAGADMIKGLANGITGALGFVRDAITGAADASLSWFKEKLGIRSPSRVFMLAGAEVSAGAALGITGGYGDVRRAALGLGMAAAMATPMLSGAEPLRFDTRAPLSTGAGRGGAASAGGTVNHIVIQAAAGMDPQAIARAVSAELDRRESAKRTSRGSSLTDYD